VPGEYGGWGAVVQHPSSNWHCVAEVKNKVGPSHSLSESWQQSTGGFSLGHHLAEAKYLGSIMNGETAVGGDHLQLLRGGIQISLQLTEQLLIKHASMPTIVIRLVSPEARG
jgi:hypothetical protein